MATTAGLGLVRFNRVGNSTQLGREGAGIVRKIWHALNGLKAKGPIYESSFGPDHGLIPASEYRFHHERYAAVYLKGFDLFINPKEHKITVGVNFMESVIEVGPHQRGEVEYHARERIKHTLRNRLPQIDIDQINEDRNGDLKSYLDIIRAKIEKMVQEAKGSTYLSARIKAIKAEFEEKPYYDLLLQVDLQSRWGD